MKSLDPGDHLSNFEILDLWKKGKRENFPATSLGFGKTPSPVIQFAVGTLKMDRNGVMYEGMDSRLLQETLKGIAVLCPHHKEMVDVAYARSLYRYNNWQGL